MARRQPPNTWRFLLGLGLLLPVLGVLALVDSNSDTPPQWPLSSTALGIFCLAAGVLCLVMAFHTRAKRE